MKNLNSNFSSCNSCDYCNNCKNCNSCDSCDYCNNCNYCNSCNSCNACIVCNFCNFCNNCNYCYSCNYCKNLRMTEYNLFCYSEESNDENSFHQKRYRVFNKEITKEEYYKISIPEIKLEFNSSEILKTRYKTAFKKAWNELSQDEKNKFLNLPNFNKDIFFEITWVEIWDYIIWKEIEVDIEWKIYKAKIIN